jgi:hypothetical protein
MKMQSPRTKEELLDAFSDQEAASVVYWNHFDTHAFFEKIGSSWSPAENVRHLSKSTRPVAKALAIPTILIRLKFGRPKHASRSYDELVERYQEKLAEGGQAGRFAPAAKSAADLDVWRREIMSEFVKVNFDLRHGIGRWSDGKLDRMQLPHPLLGDLTVREMLFFTLYHQRHHMGVVERRLREL